MEKYDIQTAEEIKKFRYDNYDEFIAKGLEAKNNNDNKEFYKIIFQATGY